MPKALSIRLNMRRPPLWTDEIRSGATLFRRWSVVRPHGAVSQCCGFLALIPAAGRPEQPATRLDSTPPIGRAGCAVGVVEGVGATPTARARVRLEVPAAVQPGRQA